MATSRKRPVASAPGPSEAVAWHRQQRILWACVLLEQLDEPTLDRLPLLLSGFQVCQTSSQAAGHEAAIAHTRQRVGPLPTRRAVQKAVRELHTAAQTQGFTMAYRIDEHSLAFTRQAGQDAVIAQARQLLAVPLPRRQTRRVLAPTTGDLTVRLHEEVQPVPITVRLADVTIAPPPQHLLRRDSQRPPLRITLAALRDKARELDALDREARGSAIEHWEDRLADILVQAWGEGSLAETELLDLTGLRHLIGLPGSGKTTLILLLCALLAQQGLRVAVFFTSIETARDYLERLRRYDVRSALLMGRSPATHARHADRLAQLVALQGHGGFGYSRPGADLLAQTCPLPAFAVDEAAAWREWQLTEAPCESFYRPESLHQDRPQPLLCPLWGACGRVRNQRELVEASVWLGHVRGADTAVPAHTSSEKLQYFELLADTFDLLIFDEVDDTQTQLDALGALTLELGGTSESIHYQAQRITGRALTGAVAPRDRQLLLPHHYAANTFERHLLRFYDQVQSLTPELGRQLENQLLTTNYLIRFSLRQAHIDLPAERKAGLRSFWESALYEAFFREANANESPQPDWAKWARQLAFSSAEVAQGRWRELVGAFNGYLYALYHDDDVEAAAELLAMQFAQLIDPNQADLLAPVARLLVAVGFGVAAYQKLAYISQPLMQYNLLPEWIVGTKTSEALRQQVPLNLLGAFSSVRFRYKEDRQQGLSIDYLLLDTTPRLLLHRLHERGANVLLASATSWLPDSPAYHVGVAPAYVLRRRHPDPVVVKLHFSPQLHPYRPGEHLFYSGAGQHRHDNLAHMVRRLTAPAGRAASGTGSPVERAARRSPSGRHTRLCALVVNSYDQVRRVVAAIAQVNPALADKTRGVLRELPDQPSGRERYLLKGQVESLGRLVVEEGVQVVVLPFTALGRGVNLVFSNPDDAQDVDNRTAAIGTVYFLTRPHPTAGDLTLPLSTIARATEQFDQLRLPTASLAELQVRYDESRQELYTQIMRLLGRPLSAHRLPKPFRRAFAANLLIPILQTIGRAIRGGSPADVYFVDAAWAPQSAEKKADTPRTSDLVMMRKLLREYLSPTCPLAYCPPVLTALYEPFGLAFEGIDGLITKENVAASQAE